MTTVADTVRYVSQILNDQEAGHEYVVWPQDLLLSSLNEGLAALSPRIPWLFRKKGTIPLTPGKSQTIPTDMKQDFKLIGQNCTRLGQPRVATNVTRVESLTGDEGCCPAGSDGMFAAPTVKPTDDCGGYALSLWAFDKADPSTFMVSPDVPVGSTASVQVSYSDISPKLLTDSLDDYRQAIPLLVDWMLFRAYSTDLKTDDVRLRADAHRTQFEVGVNRLMQTYMNGIPTEN